jgi:hypothetical protein
MTYENKNLAYLKEILLVVSRREYRVCLSVFGAYEYLLKVNLENVLRLTSSSILEFKDYVTNIKLQILWCEYQFERN